MIVVSFLFIYLFIYLLFFFLGGGGGGFGHRRYLATNSPYFDMLFYLVNY